MIAVTKYIADDGKEFEDEEECEDYEHDLKCQEFADSAFLLDEDGNKLQLTDEGFDTCTFIVCKTSEAARFLNDEFDNIMDYLYERAGKSQTGAWVYLDGEWRTVDYLISLADIAKKILEL